MDTVLVTGANRGLGLELAKQYAAEGWRVFAACRRASPALAGLAGLRPEVRVLALDVADHGSIEAAARELDGEAIDVLLNNAGTMGGRGTFDEESMREQSFGHTDYEDWASVLRVNLMGPMKMAEAFVEHVARSGQRKVVTLTSMVGSNGLNTIGGLYAYRSSKAAVNAVMKSMSIDLLKRDILAVAIHPGWASTDMGGPRAGITPAQSAAGMRAVIAGLTRGHLGSVLAWDGQVLPY